MSYISKNLSVLAYANGFTLWHYTSIDTVTVIEGADYFNDASDILRASDLILVNADTDGTVETRVTGVADITAGVVTLGLEPNQAAFVADPSGGATVDTECRTQLGAVIDSLVAAGLMAAS